MWLLGTSVPLLYPYTYPSFLQASMPDRSLNPYPDTAMVLEVQMTKGAAAAASPEKVRDPWKFLSRQLDKPSLSVGQLGTVLKPRHQTKTVDLLSPVAVA